MCSSFGFVTKASQLKDYGIDTGSMQEEMSLKALPYTPVPVIVTTPQGLKLTPMNFSLVPAWSKEPKVKFATHNARIETVTEKPAWRDPFLHRHCMIPMTCFYESVYEGPHAGHVIAFNADNPILFAAGLFDVWAQPEHNKQLFSCTILTTEPSPFILANGHDRSPIFLDFADGKSWLSLRAPAKDMVDFLLAKNTYPDLTVTRDRPLKPGWEKRK